MKRWQLPHLAFHATSTLAWISLIALTGCRSEPAKQQIKLTSTEFAEGKPIPAKCTADGANLSPPLAWSDLPEGTKELALICDDPDAPSAEPWVHWVIYKIPATATELPESSSGGDAAGRQPAGAIEGRNSFDALGYGGPAPPPGHGRHRYYFKLYALDAELDLKPGLDKDSLLTAIQGHVLGEGQLMGTYQR